MMKRDIFITICNLIVAEAFVVTYQQLHICHSSRPTDSFDSLVSMTNGNSNDCEEIKSSSRSLCPPVSPATGLPNKFYTWKFNQQIRYQEKFISPSSNEKSTRNRKIKRKSIVLVHGLFVNADHWRKMLTDFVPTSLSDSEEYAIYALDLYGCGYSDKPSINTDIAQKINGENSRFTTQSYTESTTLSPIVPNIQLGTADGGSRVADVHLRHPLNSPYNFYTWSDLVCDFVQDIVLENDSIEKGQCTLVCNSIGTITSFQAMLDKPDLFNGIFVVCPNFREIHISEVPYPSITMPIVRTVQSTLRQYGQGLFDVAANPSTVQQILYEPYNVKSAVDNTLVQVLLDPLLTPGASQVVFDTLSYSAGPLPEYQLLLMSERQRKRNVVSPVETFTNADNVNSTDDDDDKPVWICYGTADPWTPGSRVEALLTTYPNVVEKVTPLPNIGHCPHDEAPELVFSLLNEMLDRIYNTQ
jgi:pimeloyl-ACP methyl ester carboxylesterase